MGPIPADPTDAEALQQNILGALRFQHNCILSLVEEWRAKAPDFGIGLLNSWLILVHWWTWNME